MKNYQFQDKYTTAYSCCVSDMTYINIEYDKSDDKKKEKKVNKKGDTRSKDKSKKKN